MKNNRKTKILLLTSLLISCFSISGSAQDATLARAHQLLQNKEYEAAGQQYGQLIEAGYEGLALYYNYAISQYELGNFPEAILFFEKTLKMDPHHRAARHNLDLANKKLDLEFIPVESFFLHRWWKNFVLSLGVPAWTILAFFLLLSAVASFFFYLFGREDHHRKWGMRAFYPALVLFVFLLISAFERYEFRMDDSRAIVLNNVSLHEGPDQRSEQLYELLPGTKIRIIDQLGEWIKVELINREQGWMKEQGFERI
jgi:tetratricopeptide (TPR) repeat protein